MDLRSFSECQVTVFEDPYRLLITASETQNAKGKKRRESSLPEVQWKISPVPWSLLLAVHRKQPLLFHNSLVASTQPETFQEASPPTQAGPSLPAQDEEQIAGVQWRVGLTPWSFLHEAWFPSLTKILPEPFSVPIPAETPLTRHGQVPTALSPLSCCSLSPRDGHSGEVIWQKLQEDFAPASAPGEQGADLQFTGGGVMQEVWIFTIATGVLLSFLAGVGAMLLTERKKSKQDKQREKGEGWEARMAYLEEVVNRAGVLNSNFFHSLDLSQKRLESLLTQADVAEQNLRRLLHQSLIGASPVGERGDPYVTATFLLSEGEEIQQIARALKLPLAQVRLLQELQQHQQPEKTASPQEKIADSSNTGMNVSLLKEASEQLKGAGQNGMYFAPNGQQL
jgi:hypothetical protein